MRLKQTIYLVLFVCCLIIGLHQSWYHGFVNSYWLFMLAIVFVGLFRLDVSKRGIPKVDAFVQSQQQSNKSTSQGQSTKSTTKGNAKNNPKRSK